MSKDPIIVRPVFLATKEKPKDRFLFVGKISRNDSSGLFLFYLIEILSPWHPSTKVEQIVVDVLKKDFEEKEKFSIDDLEDSLKKINSELGNISHQGETDWIGNLNALIGLITDDEIHISLAGNMVGYMIRKGKISNITEGLISENDGNPLKTFMNITSGSLSKDDRIAIANVNFYDHFSIDSLKQIVTGHTAFESADEIHKILRRTRGRDVTASIFEVSDALVQINPEEKNRPDVVYVDQAIETPLHKAAKKMSPYFTKTLQSLKSSSKKTFDFGKTHALSAKSSWKEKYGPKTKDFLNRTTGRARSKSEKFSGEIKENQNFRNLGFRVKSYSEKPIEKNTTSNGLFSKIFSFFALIFQKNNRRYLYICLVVVLLVFGYLKVRSNNANRNQIKEEQEVAVAYNKATKLFSEAKEDIGLKKDGGINKLLESLSLAEKAESSTSDRDKAVSLRKEILKEIDELNKTSRIYDAKTIFSLPGKTEETSLAGNSIVSVTDEGKIYSTDIRDKESKLITQIPAGNGKIVDICYSNSLEISYLYLDSEQIWILNLSTNSLEKAEISEESGKFEKAKALASYTSNIYLLDSDAGEVWKHITSSSGFSKGSSYLNTKNTSIRGAVDLSVDGNIYVLKNDASVAKFVKGVPDQDFSLKSLPTPYEKISTPAEIATEQDSNYIYILDKSLARIVRFDKSGEFANQFVLDGISIDKFFVNPRSQKIWVVNGNNVYELNI